MRLHAVAWAIRRRVELESVLNKERCFVSVINGGQFYPGRPLNATMTIHYRFD